MTDLRDWPERQDELVDEDPHAGALIVCADCGNEWAPRFYSDDCPNCDTEEHPYDPRY